MKTSQYKKAISAALEIHRLRSEISKNIEVIAENITAREASSRSFDRDSANDAIKLVENVQLEYCNHVKCSAIYFEIEINLHCDPAEMGEVAMKHIFDGIKIN